jgi:hypothetical protein
MIQVQLQSDSTHLTCWVDKTVKPGNKITLKHHPEMWWDVIWVSQPIDFTPNRGWKVGGL